MNQSDDLFSEPNNNETKEEDLFSSDLFKSGDSKPVEEPSTVSINSEDLLEDEPSGSTQDLLDDLVDTAMDESLIENASKRKYSQDDDFDIPDDLVLTPIESDANPCKKIKFSNDEEDNNDDMQEDDTFSTHRVDDTSKPPETFGFVSANTKPKETSGFVSAKDDMPPETFGFVSAKQSTNSDRSPSTNFRDDNSEKLPETFGFISARSEKPKETSGFVSGSSTYEEEKPPETFGFQSASSKPKETHGFVSASKRDKLPPETFGFVSANSKPKETSGFVSASSTKIDTPPETFGFVNAADSDKPPETFGFVSASKKIDSDDKPPETFGFVSANSKPKETSGFVSAKDDMPPETFGFVSASSSKDSIFSDNEDKPPETFGFQSAKPPETFGFQSASTKDDVPPETFGFVNASSRPSETFGFVSASSTPKKVTEKNSEGYLDVFKPPETFEFQSAPRPTPGFVGTSSSQFQTPSKKSSVTQEDDSELFKTPSKSSDRNKHTPLTKAPKSTIKNPFVSYLPGNKETPTNKVLPTERKKQKKFVTPVKSKELFEEARKREKERKPASEMPKSTVVKTDTTPIEAPSWVPIKKSMADSKKDGTKKRRIQDLGECKQIPIQRLEKNGTKNCVITMSSTKAKTFKFNVSEFNVKYEMIAAIKEENGGREVTSIGPEEMQLLLIKYGAKKDVVRDDWVNNHYRWIVWKLSSMDRTFPNDSSVPFLTAEKVLGQLIYRYNVEYCCGKRGCLKMVAEKDAIPGLYMVLMVASLNVETSEENSDCKYVELTDGWYGIKAKLDEQLSRYVEWFKITEGMKLRICGAYFTENFEPAPPLDLPGNACLSLGINCVKKGKWDDMLGFQYRRKPFKTSFKSIRINGGGIPFIRAIVKRVYPVKYLEKKTDETGPFTIIRTKQAEDYVRNENEKQREKVTSNLFQKYYNEEKTKRTTSKTPIVTPVKRIYDGATLYKVLSSTKDEMSFYAQLNENQQQALSSYQERIESDISSTANQRVQKFIEEDPNLSRQVSSMITVKLGDCCPYVKSSGQVTESDKELILTLWNLEEEPDLFHEGNVIEIYGSKISKQSGNQITKSIMTTNFTRIEKIKTEKELTDSEKELYLYTPRTCMTVSQIKDPLITKKEVDFVGVLIHSREFDKPEKNMTIKVYYFVDHTSFSENSEPTVIQISISETPRRQYRWLLSPFKIYYFSNLTFSEVNEKYNSIKCFGNEQTIVSERAIKPYFRSVASELHNFMKVNMEKIQQTGSNVSTVREQNDFYTPRKFPSEINTEDEEMETKQTDLVCSVVIDDKYQMQVTLLDTSYNSIEQYSYPPVDYNGDKKPYAKSEDTYSYLVKVYIESEDKLNAIKFTEDKFDHLANSYFFESEEVFSDEYMDRLDEYEHVPQWIKTLVKEGKISQEFPPDLPMEHLQAMDVTHFNDAQLVECRERLFSSGNVKNLPSLLRKILSGVKFISNPSYVQSYGALDRESFLFLTTTEWHYLMQHLKDMITKPLFNFVVNAHKDVLTVSCIDRDRLSFESDLMELM